MDNLQGMDALNEAIDGAWTDGTFAGAEASEPTGNLDPMKAATDLLSFEVAEAHGNADAVRRSGDVSLAGEALMAYEEDQYAAQLEEAGIPDEVVENPEWHHMVVEADGDIDQAREQWNSAAEWEALEYDQAMGEYYDQAMAAVVDAVGAGEVDFDTLPEDVKAQAYEWVQQQEILAGADAEQTIEDAAAYNASLQMQELGQLVQQEGGSVEVYDALLEQGYDVETAANYALQARAGGELQLRGDDGLSAAFDGLRRDLGMGA
jgi:hypothetical protein